MRYIETELSVYFRAHFIENIDLLTSGSYVLVAKPDLLSNSFLETQKSYLQALKKCAALT